MNNRIAIDLSQLSTFQMARALQWAIADLRQLATPNGRVYYVDLNGVPMPATNARSLCEAEIIARQSHPHPDEI